MLWLDITVAEGQDRALDSWLPSFVMFPTSTVQLDDAAAMAACLL